jgi:glucans biosynthesis protein
VPGLSRRALVQAAPGLAGLALFPAARAQEAQAPAPAPGDPQPFSFERLIQRAREMATEPYVPRPRVPQFLADLGYDDHRQIRFRPEHSVWADSPGYRLQFFFPGSYFVEPVHVYTVEQGVAREVLYNPEMFDFGPIQFPEPLAPDLGFAGFRVHYPLNGTDEHDDLLVFLGASYFRALAKGSRYGLSARGLALNTGLGRPEEFPRFTHFWIERPPQPFEPLVIYALLDSESVVGAYRFDVSPRERTTMDVDSSLFFRADVEQVGLAPLTSMYYFGENDRAGIDDWRPQAHDSEGLSVWRGSGELTWRPLVNPAKLRLSVFSEENPRGFGLLQRDRDFASYQDLEHRYDLRPHLWVEPKGGWGKGSVRLIEIPTPDETNDNIAAFWTPEAPVSGGQELRSAYTLIWSLHEPLSSGLAVVQGTRIGVAGGPALPQRREDARRVVIDFSPANLEGVPPETRPEVVVECRNGTCSQALLERNEVTGGWRVFVEITPEAQDGVEMRCILTVGSRQISETWLYRIDNA